MSSDDPALGEGVKTFFDVLPTKATLTYAASSPVDTFDEAVPDEVTLVLSFCEKGVGFGEVTIKQTKEGVFVDTECMSLKKVRHYLDVLLERAITDNETDPEKHRLFARVMGHVCGSHCRMCYPDGGAEEPADG